MAIPAALLVFSGYPQLTHGVMLYVQVSLLAQLFQQEARGLVVRHWRKLLVTGLLAIVLAIGLSAIQFLPLLELVEQSHRSQGTAIIFDGWIPYKKVLKGVLFFYFGADQDGENVFNLANITVFGLASLLIFFRAPIRIVGQLLGLLLLFNLGMGATSPFSLFVYIHHLIPGLHYFRTMNEYFSIAVIGIAIVSAYVLDALSLPGLIALHNVFRRHLWLSGMLAALLGGGLVALCYQLHVPAYGRLTFLVPALMVPGYFLLHLSGRRSLFPLMVVLLLSIDVLTLRIHAFDFYDRGIVAQPREIRTISSEPDVQAFHVMDASLAGLMVFLPPTDASVGLAYRRIHRTLSPFTSALQWKIPSIDGVLALWLARRDLLDPVFTTEIDGSAVTRAGLRMIDILGIRYISRDATLPAIGLSLFAHDQTQSIFIYRNDFAKPRFQVYWNAEVVDTPEQALTGLQAAQSEKIFIEKRRGKHLTLPAVCATCAEAKPAIKVIEAQAMRYRVRVNMPREGWLFLADANYPGWEATVNGKAQPVYSAQVLGKAVRLQAGYNEVTIRYVPWSFYIGAILSGLTLVLVLLILFWHPVRRYLGRNTEKT